MTAFFHFNDEKSRVQIEKFRNRRNRVSKQNEDNLEEYRRKAKRGDCRGEWELEDAFQS